MGKVSNQQVMATRNSEPPEDDEEIGDFPDDQPAAEDEEDDEQEEQGTGKKRVSIIRRGITGLLGIPVETPDSQVIDAVRELQRENRDLSSKVKVAESYGKLLKSLKKELLMLAVGDQLKD